MVNAGNEAPRDTPVGPRQTCNCFVVVAVVVIVFVGMMVCAVTAVVRVVVAVFTVLLLYYVFVVVIIVVGMIVGVMKIYNSDSQSLSFSNSKLPCHWFSNAEVP